MHSNIDTQTIAIYMTAAITVFKLSHQLGLNVNVSVYGTRIAVPSRRGRNMGLFIFPAWRLR